MQVFDEAFHSIVDTADPYAALISIQPKHHRLLAINRTHEIVWIVTERDDMKVTLKDAWPVDVLILLDSDLDGTLQDANRRLQFVIQCQMRMVF